MLLYYWHHCKTPAKPLTVTKNKVKYVVSEELRHTGMELTIGH